MTVKIKTPRGYKLRVKTETGFKYNVLYPTLDEQIMHPDFMEILENYLKFHTETDGRKLFETWVEKSGLDVTKPYSLEQQLTKNCLNGVCESWRWAQPFIEKYDTDEDGVFYKVLALTGSISMNRNDYRDLEELSQTASSLSYRALNLNHDHGMMLGFPENRVDLARYEDKGVECIIRIDNYETHPLTGRSINEMIASGDIIHVSIEGTPRKLEMVNGVKKPIGYTLLGLALLEKDVTLAGDPLTYLEPLNRGDI